MAVTQLRDEQIEPINLPTEVVGILGIVNGGTGTITQFTPGSIIFAGTNGVYSQDNANFFWDNVNKRLGLGTNLPSARFHVVGNDSIPDDAFKLSVPTSSIYGPAMRFDAANAGGSIWLLTSTGTGNAGGGGAFRWYDLTANATRMIIDALGRVGIGIAVPSALLHLKAGTATIAPFKLNTGTALTTPENGAIEYHDSHIYFTIGTTRFQLDQQASGGSSKPFISLDIRDFYNNGEPSFNYVNNRRYLSWTGDIYINGDIPLNYAGGGLTLDFWYYNPSDGDSTHSMQCNASLSRYVPSTTNVTNNGFATAQSMTARPVTNTYTILKDSITFAPGTAMDGLLAGEAFVLKMTKSGSVTSGLNLLAVRIRET